MPKDSSKGVQAKIDDRRELLNCAKAMQFLTECFLASRTVPGDSDWVKAQINKLVKEIQIRSGFSAEKKRSAILRIITELDGVSIAELVERTGWHRDKIRKICNQLQDEDLIRTKPTQVSGSRGGRPPELFIALPPLSR